jgi:hypothetical protein
MPRKKPAKSKPTGCPPKVIDWALVDKKLIAGCNGVQVAACIGIHPDTLYIRCETDKGVTFSAYSQEKRSQGDSLIHGKQYEKAIEEGNVTMLIWLGKQRLGQSETLEENKVDKESLSKFNALIDQISSLRSNRNISDNNTSAAAKS